MHEEVPGWSEVWFGINKLKKLSKIRFDVELIFLFGSVEV
jgi:hypothetical protein